MKRLFKQFAVAAGIAASAMSAQALPTTVTSWNYGLNSLFTVAAPGSPGVKGVKAVRFRVAVNVALVSEVPVIGLLVWVSEPPGAQKAGGIKPPPMKVLTAPGAGLATANEL